MAPSRAAARKHTPSGRVRGGHVKLQTIRIFIRNLTPALLYARQVWSESRRKKTPGCAWGFNLGPRPQQEELFLDEHFAHGLEGRGRDRGFER
jgi:hypothetical protein